MKIGYRGKYSARALTGAYRTVEAAHGSFIGCFHAVLRLYHYSLAEAERIDGFNDAIDAAVGRAARDVRLGDRFAAMSKVLAQKI